jgi:HD superfamily phosphohydrolase
MTVVTIYDPLYGVIALPRYLEPYLLAPEFRRLGGVRLLNYESIELAALSEVRRRSHTLGVLHLGTRLGLLKFGPQDIKALLYSIVLHDIATPPFGHTLEYEFMRKVGKDHEQAASHLLDGRHHPLSIDHQVYGGRAVSIPKLIEQSDCAHAIRSILAGKHPLSTLLFGDLDLDNIDNVFRMCWYLGIRCKPADAVSLASLIEIDVDGSKLLRQLHRPLVETWRDLRVRAYKALFESPRHRRNQAIFSRIILEALEPMDGDTSLIDEDDWFLTDEELVAALRKAQRLRPYFADLDRVGQLPEVMFQFELDTGLNRSDQLVHRDRIMRELAEQAIGRFYVTLIPFGEALERRVAFRDPDSGEEWSVGEPRRVYRVFVHLGGKAAREATASSLNALRGKVEDYAERHGWVKAPRSTTAAA